MSRKSEFVYYYHYYIIINHGENHRFVAAKEEVKIMRRQHTLLTSADDIRWITDVRL